MIEYRGMDPRKILILGGTGMLGHALFCYFGKKYDAFTTIRKTKDYEDLFPPELNQKIIPGINISDIDSIRNLIEKTKFDLVINCIGIIKQDKDSTDSKLAIAINSLFPHQLAEICKENGTRVIHISTDCVFSGNKGNYKEEDYADADDIYGRTKLLGEIDYSNTVTLRTSIIGHEIERKRSLVDWFLSQQGEVNGFTNAIYTGIPTIELAEIIDHHIIENPDMRGLYHVSSDRISKYELLSIIKKIYQKDIKIDPCDNPKIDRSLDSSRFRATTGYRPPSWESLISKMHSNYLEKESFYQKQ